MMNLKTKVLNFINQNDSGVKISDMEIPLGENRMKLGFVTKTLLLERKIQKIEDRYFSVDTPDNSELKYFKRFSK